MVESSLYDDLCGWNDWIPRNAVIFARRRWRRARRRCGVVLPLPKSLVGILINLGEIDVGEGVARVAGARRLVIDRGLHLQDFFEDFDEPVERDPFAATDVDNRACGVRRASHEDVSLDHVVDIGEVTRLFPVAVDDDRFSSL